MGVTVAMGELGGGEEERVGKEWTPRWLGLPLRPEKAPPGCFLYPCLREEGTCGGIEIWRPILNLQEKLVSCYELRQKSVICHLIFFFVRKSKTDN